jgi:hypothetical protein
MGLFGILATILLGLAISSSGVADDTRQLATVGDESRLGMERMTRELRQAARIADVVLPHGAGQGPTRFTLWADFDANGCINRRAADPEELTYTWDPDARYLTLSAVINGVAHTSGSWRPRSPVRLSLNSSSWQYDANQDGTTTSQEIERRRSAIGNPRNFTSAELEHIDLVGLSTPPLTGRTTWTTRQMSTCATSNLTPPDRSLLVSRSRRPLRLVARRSGAALVITLMVMALVAALATTVATLSIRNLQSARLSQQGWCRGQRRGRRRRASGLVPARERRP